MLINNSYTIIYKKPLCLRPYDQSFKQQTHFLEKEQHFNPRRT